MKILNFFLLSTFVTINLQGFTQQELVDSADTYFSAQISTINEAQIDQIMQEIDLISTRDGLDKVLVLQQLSDRLHERMQYHAKRMGSKWSHPALWPVVASVAVGIGFLGLAYWIYKKWDAPLNTEFDAITQNLKQYGITVKENKYDTYHGPKHVTHHHIINYNYSRYVTDTEQEIILSSVRKLLELRKRQEKIGGYEAGSVLGTIFALAIGSKFTQEIYDADPKLHLNWYEKYQLILQRLNGVNSAR